jgi:hypothetical protein
MAAARDGWKTCSGCRERRPVHRFYRDRSRSDGLSNVCARCKIAANKAYLARLTGHPKAMRDSYRLALSALTRERPAEFARLLRRQLEEIPREDSRTFHGHGERWDDARRYPEPGVKRCRACSEIRLLSHEYWYRDRSRTKDGFAHRCRACQNGARRGQRYADQRDALARSRAKAQLRDRYREQFLELRAATYETLMAAVPVAMPIPEDQASRDVPVDHAS